MKKIIDLSCDITHQMPVFPSDPPVGILTHHNYSNGYFVNQIIFGTHTGTHVDVPAHRFKGRNTIEKIEIDSFIQKAFIMDFTSVKELEEIDAAMLDKFKDKIKGINAVIIKTNWSYRFGTKNYFTSFPGLAEDTADWFQENDISLIGLESPSVHAVKHLEVHSKLLGKEIYVIESLTNVDKISKEYVMLFAVPLKFKGLDGSPVRAFAIEE